MSIVPSELKKFVEDEFTKKVLPSLQDFIKIEDISPAYDPDWNKNKLLLKAATHLKKYAEISSGILGLTAQLSPSEDKTPFLLINIEGTSGDNKSVLFYGHFDKQPGGDGWQEGFGPFTPVVKDEYLYGRGGADDGYAVYAVLTMIRALQNFKIPHPKFIIMAEGAEESGSIDLPFYLDEYQQFIGNPDLIVTMDGGAGDYDHIWLCSSLRGIVSFDLTVNTLTKGVHSGKCSGVAPESFMIVRKLISKLESYSEKRLVLKDFEVDIPESVRKEAENTVKILGDSYFNRFPLLKNVELLGDKGNTDLYLNNTWRPSLSILGAGGIPSIKEGGNVLRPFSTVRVSIRTPPTFDSITLGSKIIVDTMTKNTPFNATVNLDNFHLSNGVQLKDTKSELKSELNKVSVNYLKGEVALLAVGGAIPFTSIFPQYFPNSQIIVTGAAGPDSNIHGPMEKLNLTYTKNFISTFANLLANYKNFL